MSEKNLGKHTKTISERWSELSHSIWILNSKRKHKTERTNLIDEYDNTAVRELLSLQIQEEGLNETHR